MMADIYVHSTEAPLLHSFKTLQFAQGFLPPLQPFSKTMLPVFILWLCLLAMVNAASIFPSTLPQILAPSNHLTLIEPDVTKTVNVSSKNDDLQAPGFTFSFQEGTTPLPSRACLMVALEALVQLSFNDFEEEYSEGSFLSNEYPGVIIAITTTRIGLPTFQTKFAVQSVKEIIATMMQENRYRNSSITVFWSVHGYPVPCARVGFLARGGATIRKASDLAQRIEISLRQGLTLVNFTNINNGTDFSNNSNKEVSGNDGLGVSVEFVGDHPLTIPDVFLTLYSALLYIAQFPTTDATRPFIGETEDANVLLEFNPIDPPPRSTFAFQYGWAARSLLALPEYMFQRGMFNEIEFMSGWDSTLFAVGSLKKRASSGPSLDVARA